MSEDNRVQDAGRMARMEADISHLTKSFDEFKDETKEFHERQTDMLEELKEGWQKFGGVVQGLATIQRQANDHERWISENREFIASLKEDKKDTKGRLKDFLYSFVIPQLLTAIVLYLVLIWKQQQAIDQIIKSLK